VKQVKLEALTNAAIKTLRFELKMKVHPRVSSPKRKVAVFPMKRKVYEALFPTAKPCKIKEDTSKPLSYLSKRKIYEIELSVEQLAVILGSDWYYTFGGADVAVHVGEIIIRLIECKRTEYKTTLDQDWPEVIKDTIVVDTAYFCRVEFSYRKVTRWDHALMYDDGVQPDTGVWKTQATKLQKMSYKKVRLARVLKKVNEQSKRNKIKKVTK
jgi:hypothetical protein